MQISKGWQTELKKENTFLMGLYKYKATVLYVFFDSANYSQRETNNSSAHVTTFDLLKGFEQGTFTKKDIRNNVITVVRQDKALDYLEKLVKKEIQVASEIELFENFKAQMQKEYFGIDCYQEMMAANYRNTFQPEWVGFYLEYKFEKYLSQIDQSIVMYQSLKSRDAIDLDLNFNNVFFGDLKAHSIHSNAILGNDLSNIEKSMQLTGKIWYVVFNHTTKKDDESNYEVTLFWNESQKKTNLMSYSSRMKHSISFLNFQILEINEYNKHYLTAFNQGVNSNGLKRATKIKIDKKRLNNFLIYHSEF